MKIARSVPLLPGKLDYEVVSSGLGRVAVTRKKPVKPSALIQPTIKFVLGSLRQPVGSLLVLVDVVPKPLAVSIVAKTPEIVAMVVQVVVQVDPLAVDIRAV